MAMNTVTTTSSVGQVDRSNPTITTNAKVTNDSSAAFQPQTQVNLDNSMKNMLTMLSKIAISEDAPIQEIPAELQKLVNNILQNAFSVDTSISQGLSNTLQSQKASIDQLNLLSKLLEQLSMEVSTEGIANLSDTFKTLLANTKLLDGQDGKLLDSTALNKMAMQLLDGKSMENMPEVLQTLLIQNNQSNTMLQAQQLSSNMNFLKQLIKQFMPSPQENQTLTYTNQSNTTNTTNTANTTNTNTITTTNNNNIQTAMNDHNNAVNSNTNTQNNTTTNQTITNNNIETNQNSIKNNNTQNNMSISQQATIVKDNPLNKMVIANPSTMQTTSHGQSAEVIMQSQDGELNLTSENNSNSLVIKEDSNNSDQDSKNNTLNRNSTENGQQNQLNKTSLPLQNTTTTMQLMKSLANQMLSGKNVSLSMEEFELLKNFVNDKQQVLNEREVKNLQTLIKMSEENLPATIRQAAIKQKLPNLPKLWSFVQLCDLTQLTDLPANKLKSSSKSISDFAGLLKSSMQNENDVNENQNQRSMSLMTPLYLGDNAHCYPTYIHVYDQTPDGRDLDDNQKETWFRICLLTENMGAVELVFRLYEQSKLNLRVTFSDNENVKSFNEYIPEIKAAFKEMPLDLTEVKVSAIGG